MAIKISGTTVIDNDRNINAGIGTFTNLNVTPQALTFSPADGATNVSFGQSISITFSQLLQKGTGNITLRNSSGIGTVIQTIGVTSTSVTISGAEATIVPPTFLPINTDVYVVVDAGAFTSVNFTSPIQLINTYNFTTNNFAFSSITPTNGATEVAVNTNITLAFTGSAPVRGTGTITLRSGSAGGTIIESFNAASSGRISISGNNWILDPTSDLPVGPTLIFLVIPNTGIANYAGLNVAGADTHSFTTAAPALGSSYEGGFLICKASPLRWVVSPYSAEVTRSFTGRNDANTRAQQVSGCTGWFVPTCGQLQNPGYCCRSFWGPSPCFSSCLYWTSSPCGPNYAFCMSFLNGIAIATQPGHVGCVRAFRCVTY